MPRGNFPVLRGVSLAHLGVRDKKNSLNSFIQNNQRLKNLFAASTSIIEILKEYQLFLYFTDRNFTLLLFAKCYDTSLNSLFKIVGMLDLILRIMVNSILLLKCTPHLEYHQ